MRKHIWLILLSLPLIFACGLFTKRPGLLIYEASGENGKPAPEVIVADSSGNELRRIQLPETPLFLQLTRSSHKSLAWLTDHRVFLLDAEAGTAQELDVEGEVSPLIGLFPGGWRQYAVLANPRGNPVYLVNLETGETTNLIELDKDIRLVFSGQFSPDERYLAIFGTGLWLVPTEDPQAVRKVGGDDSAFGIAFSSDSRQIVYTTRSDEKSTIVVEAVDGSKSEEVLSADDFVAALEFMPGQENKIVLGREGSTSLLDMEGGEEQELMTHEGFARRMFPAPEGQKSLLWIRGDSGDLFYLMDPSSGKMESLDDLKGYLSITFAENPAARWVYFVDAPGIGEARSVVSLDLKTGETQEVLSLDEGSGLYLPPRTASSPDGRLALATVLIQADNVMQLWLLDAQSGEARMLAEGDIVNGAISSDNRWIAYGVLTRDGDEVTAELFLVSAENGEAQSLGPGSRPVWLYP